MPGLPKIALARLKANPEAPKSSGAPSGADAFQGGQHPDANLLSAFAEKTLTEKERTQVLNHLSQCADCREIAAFVVPAEEAMAEPARGVAGRRSIPWLALRWGAMAAVLGALTIVVVLHPGMWNGHRELSKLTPPPVPAGKIMSAPQTVSPPPLAPPSPETARAKAQEEANKSAGGLAAVGKAPAPQRNLTRDDRIARPRASQQVTMMASTRPPATFRSENGLAVKTEQEGSRGGNALVVGASVEPAPAPMAASEDMAKSRAEPQAGPATVPAMSQSVEVTASAGTLHATTESVQVTGANPSPNPPRAAAAKAAPRAAAQANGIMASRASLGGMAASRKVMGFEAGPPAALWKVTSDGKVQRSADRGKTFEPVSVADGIKFRAIAALGNEVWVGGAGGALFHSVDGGATWSRAGISFEGNAVTETITGIQLHDPQHLTVTTASGSQWVSEDGGQNWQKQP